MRSCSSLESGHQGAPECGSSGPAVSELGTERGWGFGRVVAHRKRTYGSIKSTEISSRTTADLPYLGISIDRFPIEMNDDVLQPNSSSHPCLVISWAQNHASGSSAPRAVRLSKIKI